MERLLFGKVAGVNVDSSEGEKKSTSAETVDKYCDQKRLSLGTEIQGEGS